MVPCKRVFLLSKVPSFFVVFQFLEIELEKEGSIQRKRVRTEKTKRIEEQIKTERKRNKREITDLHLTNSTDEYIQGKTITKGDNLFFFH